MRVRGLALAGICAATIGLAACGDDDDDTAATETTTTEAEATTATETTDATETTEDTEDTEDTTTEGGETTETEGTEASGGDVTEFLRSQLAGAGIPKDQVDCVVDELESTLGEDELEQLQTATTASQEVIDASTAAAQKCLAP